MAGRRVLETATYVPAAVVMWVAMDLVGRFTHPLITVAVGVATFWGAAAVMDRLTAPFRTD